MALKCQNQKKALPKYENAIFSSRHLFIFFLFAFITITAQAAPTSLNYQGRIVKSDGTPLEYSAVSFDFKILDPAGACVIYEEQVSNVDMTASGGIFDVVIGSGTIIYPTSGTPTVLDAFNNAGVFTCAGGGTYNATSIDLRKLHIQFHDGTAWETISSDIIVRSVPFAAYAMSSEKLGTHVDTDFILKSILPTCTGGTFLTYDGTNFTCAASGAGGLTSVTSANSYISVASTTTAPVLTLNVGTGANTVAAGDDSRITGLSTTYLAQSTFNGYVTSAGCSTSQTMYWNSVTGFNCQTIAAAAGSMTGTVPVANGGTGATSTSQNFVFAGPTSGSGAPSFRALASGDISSLAYVNGGNSFGVAATLGTTDANSLSLITGGTARVTLDNTAGYVLLNPSGGNVGIGTTTPTESLQIVGGSINLDPGQSIKFGTNAYAFIDGGDGGGTSFLALGTNGANVMEIDSIGQVGIGISPSYTFDVVGDINIHSPSGLLFDGIAVCTSSGCTSPSDRRLKENIAPLNNSLENILKLQGVSYDWKDKEKFGKGHQIGLIAQDLEKIYPEVVLTDAKTGGKTVAYDHLIAPIIESIKVLNAKIAELFKTSDTNSRDIASLKAENSQLKDQVEKNKQQNAALKSYLCAKDPQAAICK